MTNFDEVVVEVVIEGFREALFSDQDGEDRLCEVDKRAVGAVFLDVLRFEARRGVELALTLQSSETVVVKR